MKVRGFFVAGTDTEVGKTSVSLSLIRLLASEGRAVVGMKPVASGIAENQRMNEDARLLQAVSAVKVPPDLINPYPFSLPIAPHIAAAREGVLIDQNRILEAFEQLLGLSDCIVVEGAGGWLVPLGPGWDFSNLALAMRVPVILVVGLRLGCISHARLTIEAIKRSGAPFAGWVANCLDPGYSTVEETLDTLTFYLGGKPLAVLPYSVFPEGLDNHWNRGEILRMLNA